MSGRALKIFDETLRDGEQQAGVFLAPELKRHLAGLLRTAGVHRIDIMPAVDAGEAALARQLLEDGWADCLAAATPVGRRFVDQAIDCGFRHAIVFYAVSDRLLFLRDPAVRDDPALAVRTIDDGVPAPVIRRCRDEMLERLVDTLAHARAAGLTLDFAAEDASRADRDFLVHRGEVARQERAFDISPRARFGRLGEQMPGAERGENAGGRGAEKITALDEHGRPSIRVASLQDDASILTRWHFGGL